MKNNDTKIEENDLNSSTNEAERLAELAEYSKKKQEEIDAEKINSKEARQEADRIFRIVFGTLCLLALGIVTYRYLR